MWSLVHWCQVSGRCTWFTRFTFRSRRWLVRLVVPVLGYRASSHCIWWTICFEVLPNVVTRWQGVALGNSHMKRYSLLTVCAVLCVNSVCRHVLWLCICLCNFILSPVCVQSNHVCEQHLSSVHTLGPWIHIQYHKEIKSCLVHNLL